MIPQGLLDADIKVRSNINQSKTYKSSADSIEGFTDGAEALKQAIYKVLDTKQYEYPIYSFSYGIDLESLIGKDQTYVKIEFKRRVRECLLKDERIKSVDNFNYELKGDVMLCTFDVASIFGDIAINGEVNI